MSAVKDIEFTKIAADWDSITLGERSPQALLAIRNGLTTKQNQDNGDYKVSRIETIGGGWIDETKVRFASNVKEKDVEKYRIQKGDILFSHINSDPHLGKTGFAERDYEDLLHGMNLLLIRANPEVFEAEFLNRVFQYYRDIGVFISICSRSVNQSSINQAKLKAVEVPLPPLPEQKKIAHILSTVQRAIEAQARIIQTTTELKRALMHKLFTEGLRNEPQKQTEIGPIPESWEVVALESKNPRLLIVMRNGYTGKQTFEVQKFRVSRIETIGAGFIDRNRVRYAVDPSQSVIDKYLVRRGDILFSHINSDPHLGKTGIADCETFDLLHGMNLLLIRANQKVLNPWFLNYLFQWYREKGVFIAICSRAVNQSSINQGKMNALEIPLPEMREQAEIAAALGAFEEKTTHHERKLASLQDLFRTLLHELMTAKIRVHEVEPSIWRS